MDSSEETIEKLDQEITLQLQKIDSNLSYCFNKITKDIIPEVARYGAVCDDIMDSGNWLGTMFQQTAAVDLKLNSPLLEDAEAGAKEDSKSKSPESLFPVAGGRKLVDSSSELPVPAANVSMSEDDFHTANVTTTTTGQVLRLPSDSSDDEADDDGTNNSDKAARDGDGSTLQRQRRKRKVSLLLQREYGSSSSMGLSPVNINLNKSRLTGGKQESLDSSPIKASDDRQDAESTKEAPRPGTIIHFATGSVSAPAAPDSNGAGVD